jgi:uncharacterized membrane protein
MRVEIMAMLIPIFLVLGLFTMIVFLRFFKNVERMKMIEKGMDPKDLNWSPEEYKKYLQDSAWSKGATLKAGLLALGAGIGLITAAANETTFGDIGYSAFVLIGGGIGLIVSYIIQFLLDKNKID